MQKLTTHILFGSLLTTHLFATSPLEIPTVTIVSALKTPESIQNITSQYTIITAKELEEKHISTLTQALRLANISIAQSGINGQQSSFYLNGLSSGNTLVMIDGIRYNDPTNTEGQAQLEHIMLYDIEQIEIINGAQSGIWGADAVAGVINIVTKKPSKEGSLQINAEYGSYNTRSLGLHIAQQKNSFDYSLSLYHATTNGISAQAPNMQTIQEYENDKYANTTLHAKFSYSLVDSDTISANLTHIHANADYDPYADPNGKENTLTQNNTLYKVLYKHYFNTQDYLQAAYCNATFKKEDPLGWTTKFQGVNHDLTLDSKITYYKNSFILLGASRQKNKDTINANDITSKGFYLTNNNIFEQFIATQSIRRDAYDLFNDKTTAKIGVKYYYNEQISFATNYATAYKAPSLYQLTYNNPSDLEPETTKSFDAIFTLHQITLAYFKHTTTNLIQYSDQGTYDNYTDDIYTNVAGKSKFQGYTINYRDTIVENLIGEIDYKKQSAKDEAGNDLPRRIDQNFKIGLNYYGFAKMHIGVIANYIGKRYDDAEQTKQTGKYTLVDIVTNYTINTQLKTYFKINNLTNKLYQEVDGYATMPRTIAAGIHAIF